MTLYLALAPDNTPALVRAPSLERAKAWAARRFRDVKGKLAVVVTETGDVGQEAEEA